jgi:hypothetical protein
VWPRSSEGLAIGISAGAVAIRGSGSDAWSHATYAAAPMHNAGTSKPWAELRSALTQALKLQQSTHQVATVVVADDVARHWVQPPPAGVGSLAELRAVAASRFGKLFGDGAEGWSIVGDWRIGRPFVCAAIPRWVPRALEAALPAQRPASNAFVRTQLGLALQRFGAGLPQDGWWCVVSVASMTIGHTSGGHVDRLRCVGLAAHQPDDTLRIAASMVKQEAARAAAVASADVAWIDLAGAAPNEKSKRGAEHGGMRFTRLPIDLRTDLGDPSRDALLDQAAIAAALGKGAAT